MHVKFNLILFLRIIRKFGLSKGIKLFFQLKNNKGNQISVPGLPFPIYLRPKTSDLDTFAHVFIYDEYNIPWENELFKVIDAGANIGMFAVYMTIKYPEAKIICIEPDKENFNQLLKNTKDYDSISSIQNGVWYKECHLQISDKFNWGKWAMIIEEVEENGDIHCLPITQILEKFEINQLDLIKIDIETSEKEVFSQNYSEWLSKTNNIVIELHDRLKQNCSKTFFTAVNSVFESYEYSCNGENTILMNCKTDSKIKEFQD